MNLCESTKKTKIKWILEAHQKCGKVLDMSLKFAIGLMIKTTIKYFIKTVSHFPCLWVWGFGNNYTPCWINIITSLNGGYGWSYYYIHLLPILYLPPIWTYRNLTSNLFKPKKCENFEISISHNQCVIHNLRVIGNSLV